MQDVKIFVCCHKDYKDVGITDPRYVLISDKDIKNDSSLELIKIEPALDNRLWSELSYIYYILKHPELQSDWIGIAHYRRYFDFMNDIPELEKPMVVKNITNVFNNYINYSICHYGADLLTVTKLMKNEAPEYLKYMIRMLDSHHYMPYNMAILPKDVFNDLWNFIFRVLFKLDSVLGINGKYEEMFKHVANYREHYIEKRMKPNDTYEYQMRLYGFLAERLFTTYFIKYINENGGYDSIIENEVVVTEKTYNKVKEKHLNSVKQARHDKQVS